MKYDAFISYRHTKLDKEIAIKLHKILETYKAPNAVGKKSGKKKLTKVFRDQDELPTSSNLSQSIDEALNSSEYLIVVCSPDTPKSSWVLKEIDTFIKLRGHDKILALLIAGEPEESFPQNLRFITNEQGEEIEIEPLAADIRADSVKKMGTLLKQEALRILAPIFGCSFDELRQRHRERRIKAVATASAAAALFFATFGSYSVYQNVQIKHQSQKTLESQSLFLANLSANLLNEGDRQRAMLLALEALPENLSNPERPLVSEAILALCESAGVYKNETNFSSSMVLKHKRPVNDMKLSDDGKVIVTGSIDGNIYIWDGERGKELYKAAGISNGGNQWSTAITSDGKMIYYIQGNEKVVALGNLNEVWSVEQDVNAISLSHNNKILAIGGDNAEFYNAENGEKLFSLNIIDSYVLEIIFSYDDSVAIVNTGDKLFVADMRDKSIIYSIDKGDEISRDIKFSYDGKYFFNSTFERYNYKSNTLAVYETVSGEVVYSFETTNDNILASNSIIADFCEDDSNLLLHSVGSSLIVHNIEENETQASCVFSDSVSAIIPLGNLMMASSEDGIIKFLRAEDLFELDWRRLTHSQNISMMKFVRGTLLTADRYSNDVYIWKIITNPNAEIIANDLYWQTAVSPDGAKLAYINKDDVITVIDLSNKNEKITFPIDGEIKGLCLSDEGLFVIDDKKIYSFGYNGEKNQQAVESHSYVYYSDDNSIVIMKDFSDFRVYDTKTCELMQVIDTEEFEGYVSDVIISPNNEMAFLIESDGKNVLYSLKEQKIIFTFEYNDLTAAAFNNHSDLLAFSNGDGIYIYDLTTFKLTNEQARDSIVLENAEIESLQFISGNDNKKSELLLVGFMDYTTVIYGVKSNSNKIGKTNGLERLYEFEGASVFDKCVINKEANIALLIDEGKRASVLDLTTFKKTAGIAQFYGFVNNNKIIVSSDSEIIIMPYYSTEMLIEEAKRQLNGMTLSQKEKLKYFILE